ncbi:uncharacterized protein LOC121390669 [Gigantopelta aegis]|uniref:uncharacterized protein LOC121390669 n=1 Tax=Gigantopelta aegis TaxID=1735272 RepID=UPI001B888BDE|nr:uncharacterized protein LOC121390669 [Gigantopelta aegis]
MDVYLINCRTDNIMMVTERIEDRDSLKTPILAMPLDIYDEFQALKNATHLDSTTLMRKLLQDYHRNPAPEHQGSTSSGGGVGVKKEQHELKENDSSLFHFTMTTRSTSPEQGSSPGATRPSSPPPAAQTLPPRHIRQTIPSTANPAVRSSSVSPSMSSPVAMTPIFRSSSASPLIPSNKTALFQMSPTEIPDSSSREQPLDLTVLCKSESVDKGTEKANNTSASTDTPLEILHTPVSGNGSSIGTSDMTTFGFSANENTLIMASGMPSRYHVVMTPGLGSEYSLLMPMPMSMQLPTILASNQQPNAVRIETASTNTTVNSGGIPGSGERVAFPQFQAAAALPFGVAVSQSQQNLNLFQAPVASQAGRSQPQLSSSPVALHPQMMQQLSIPQMREQHHTLTPLAVSQQVPQLSFKPQQISQESSTPKTVMQQHLQQQSVVQPVSQSLQFQSAAHSRHTPNQPPQAPQPPQPPQPARRGRKPGSRGGKAAKPAAGMGEMKIIQENITFPGVYTSILKLPWSRRARYKTHTDKESRTTPATKASSVLFPMESVITASSKPTSTAATAADTHPDPSTTQSVMMVYPNATISALGKPVRRRGRPPKLPLISHLLAEKNSRTPVSVTQVTTSIANQEAASMLADGSLMSFLSKESIGASVLHDVKVTASNTHAMDNHISMDIGHHGGHQSCDKTDTYSAESGHTTPQTADEKAKADSMYQEMILSSRELISVKPRKRQLNDYMKSEDHFLCSSFKLKPRKTKPSRTAAVELAERRKHTQTDKTAESYLVGKTLAMLAAKLNPQTMSGGPPDELETVSNHSTSNAESYHCEQSQDVNSPKSAGASLCNPEQMVDTKPDIFTIDSKKDNTDASFQEKYLVEQSCKSCKSQIKNYISKTDAQEMTLNDVQCEKCLKSLDVADQNDSGGSETGTKISCDLCGNYFSTSIQLGEHHREVHSKEMLQGEEEYDCSFCGEVFCDVEQLRTHVLTHKADLIPCDMGDCPRFFSTQEELARHVKEHEKKRLFTCVYDGCKNRFLKNFHLQEHVRVKHFNIRAFRCPWSGCEKQFAAERHLKVHLLIHREEKPLECEFCNYRCRQRNALNWHMRKHPEAPYKYRKFGMLGAGDDV